METRKPIQIDIPGVEFCHGARVLAYFFYEGAVRPAEDGVHESCEAVKLVQSCTSNWLSANYYPSQLFQGESWPCACGHGAKMWGATVVSRSHFRVKVAIFDMGVLANSVQEGIIAALSRLNPREAIVKLPAIRTIRLLVEQVSKLYDLTEEEVRGKRRLAAHVEARHLIMYIARMELLMSYKSIGDVLGLDRTSVMHAVESMSRRLNQSADLRKKLKKVMEVIGS